MLILYVHNVCVCMCVLILYVHNVCMCMCVLILYIHNVCMCTYVCAYTVHTYVCVRIRMYMYIKRLNSVTLCVDVCVYVCMCVLHYACVYICVRVDSRLNSVTTRDTLVGNTSQINHTHNQCFRQRCHDLAQPLRPLHHSVIARK